MNPTPRAWTLPPRRLSPAVAKMGTTQPRQRPSNIWVVILMPLLLHLHQIWSTLVSPQLERPYRDT